jgi:streptogramin lyase
MNDDQNQKITVSAQPETQSIVVGGPDISPENKTQNRSLIKKLAYVLPVVLILICAGVFFALHVGRHKSNQSEKVVAASTNDASVTLYKNINPQYISGFDKQNNLWLSHTNESGITTIEEYSAGFSPSSKPISYTDNVGIGNNQSGTTGSLSFDPSGNARFVQNVETDQEGSPATYLQEIPAGASSSAQPLSILLSHSYFNEPANIGSISVQIDPEGNYWSYMQSVGTLLKTPAAGFPNSKPVAFDITAGLPVILLDPKGNAWVEGFSDDLVEIPANAQSSSQEVNYTLPSSIDLSNQEGTLKSDSQGNIWIDAGNYLAEIPTGSKPSATSFPIFKVSGSDDNFILDSNGNVWVSESGSELAEIPAGSKSNANIINYTIPNGLAGPTKQSIKESLNGCTDSSKCNTDEVETSVPSPFDNIQADNKGNIWIPEWDEVLKLTGSGTNKSNITAYKLPSNTRATNLLIDNTNHVWLYNNLSNVDSSDATPPTSPDVFTKINDD